jgi:exopolysaccharide biosynthesis polyprenyl glycosylphosphotransferase
LTFPQGATSPPVEDNERMVNWLARHNRLIWPCFDRPCEPRRMLLMGTKVVETRGMEGSLGRGMPRAGASTGADRLANLLKRKMAGRALFLAGDVAALALAHLAAIVLVRHFLQVPDLALNPRNYAAFYLPFLLVVLFVFERNQRPDLRRPEKELELVVKGTSLAFVLLLGANFMIFKTGFSRYLMVSWYLLALMALLAVRFGLRFFYGALWQRGVARQKTLLVGSAEKLFELQTLLSVQRYRGYELLGIVPAGDDPPEEFENNALPVLGSIDRWHHVARQKEAEQVIVALKESTPEAHGLIFDILKRCRAEGIDVQVYSDLFASRGFNYELDEFSGFFRFFAAPRWSNRVQKAAKSLLDLMAGVVGSVITLLVLPVVALLIKIEDGGPIFYLSEFIDRDGNVRYYRKFRSMYTNAEEILKQNPLLEAKFHEKHKLIDDPRVTRVGRVLRKYSIDEFPEFFSVLSSQLSLVGPRTICRKETIRYGGVLPKLLSARPGLTGFWQVMGRQLTTYEERIQMDMFYIDHWSIWLDFWIVAKTFWKVIRAEGAF